MNHRAATTIILMLTAALALPAQAFAQEDVATPATPRPVPPPAAVVPGAPAPAQVAMKLKVQRVGGTRRTALVGTRLRVRGTVAGFAPNEKIKVRVYIAGRKRLAKEVTLQLVADGSGAFQLSYRPSRPGTLTVRASHAASPALAELKATAPAVDIIPRRVGPSSGPGSVRSLQRRLRRLGYVVGRRGVYDGRTARAVLAFRKVTDMARTLNASKDVMRAIARGRGRFVIKRPDHGRHIEADLSRQVIALIEGGKVARIYPVSSGAPSTPTVVGAFRVYSKTPGTNAKGMVHSAYFIRGYATHGFASVPVYPASHGCLRVPIPDALSLFRWITIGTPVDVYP